MVTILDDILIPNWDKFQHYKTRSPAWICNHLELLHKDEYLELSLGDRGALHALWMIAAQDRKNVGKNVATLSVKRFKTHGYIPGNHVQRILKRLTQAGFIQLSASEPLAYKPLRAKRQRHKEPTSVGSVEVDKSAAKRNLEFDLLGEIFGYLPSGQEARLWGKLSADLRKQRPHVDLELLHEAARRYKLDMPGVTITAPALVKHYPRLMAGAWHAPNGNGHGKGLTFDQLKQAALRQPAGRTPDERPASRPALGSGEGRLSFDADPA